MGRPTHRNAALAVVAALALIAGTALSLTPARTTAAPTTTTSSVPTTVPTGTDTPTSVDTTNPVGGNGAAGRGSDRDLAATIAGPCVELRATTGFADCVIDAARTLVTDAGPEAALAGIRDVIAVDEDVALNCHSYTHPVGQAAYRTLGLPGALAADDRLCEAGYLHGIIEAFGASATPAEFTAQAPAICDSFAGEEGRGWAIGGGLLASCLHGVGHGAAAAIDDDVVAATALCDVFAPNVEHQELCADGAIMMYAQRLTEASWAGEPLESSGITAGDAEQVCDQLGGYRATCLYRWAAFWGALDWTISDMFAACDAITDFTERCAHGIGSHARGLHGPRNLGAAFAECAAAPAAIELGCYQGIIEISTRAHVSSGRDIESSCTHLDDALHRWCSALEARVAHYERPPEAR